MSRERERETAAQGAFSSRHQPQDGSRRRRDGVSVQTSAGNRAVARLLRPGHADAERGPGGRLPLDVRRLFEHSFGRRLNRVRVHQDAPDVAEMGARAVTSGASIAFAPGEYAPKTRAGRTLLAHEVAHAVQQSGRTAGGTPASEPRLEAEAQQAATAAVAGRPASVGEGTAVGVQPATKLPPSPLEGRDKYVIEMPWGDPRTTDKRPIEEQLATPPKKGQPTGTGSLSELGYLRDQGYFWNEYLKRWPDHLSKKNRKRIADGNAPVVDATWIKHYPQDRPYKGQTLEHHHTGQGSRAVGMPEKLHDAYTVFHPKRIEVAGKQRPTETPEELRKRQEKETARHVREGRIKGAGITKKKPPPQPAVPPSSELSSVPEAERRPVDPISGRVSGETRYPPPKYTPPSGTAKQPPQPYQHELPLEGEVEQRRPAPEAKMPTPTGQKKAAPPSTQLELPLEKKGPPAQGPAEKAAKGPPGDGANVGKVEATAPTTSTKAKTVQGKPPPFQKPVRTTPRTGGRSIGGARLPSVRATGGQAGAQLLADYIGVALHRLNEYGIQKRINEEIAARRPAIDTYRDTNIDDGVLLVLRIAGPDPRAPRPAEAVPLRQLVAVSEQRGGRTKEEAVDRWHSEPKWLIGAPKGMIEEEPAFVWIPPRRAVRPFDWIGGNYRSEGMHHYVHIEFGPQGELAFKAWDYTDGEVFTVAGVGWQVEWDPSPRTLTQGPQLRSISLTATLTKRSTGITSKSLFTVRDENTLVETFEIDGTRGERIWEKAPF